MESAPPAPRLRAIPATSLGAVASRRAQAFVQAHHGPSAVSPAAAMVAAKAQHLSMAAAQSTSLASAWIAAGPVQVQSQRYGLVTGRVTALALDPNDATNNTLYVGTSGGGVWKSTNAASQGVSFLPLTDTLPVFAQNAGSSAIPSLSIGALSVQPGGTGVVLAGTGDPNDATDSFYGEGVLRSTDNGLTWSQIQSSTSVGEGVSGFAWSTTSPSLVVMAVSSAAEGATVGASNGPGVRGLWYSVDAGASWTLATLQDGANVLQNRSTNYTSFRGNAATSVVWNPVRRKFYAAIRSHGFYESPDGATWTRMVNQPGAGLTTGNCQTRPGDYGLASCPIFRGTLAVQPVSGDLFAVSVDSNNLSQGLWQDSCQLSGTTCASASPTWSTSIDITTAQTNGTLPAGDYNLALAAVPAATALSVNDTLLFLGTADLYRCSLASGCTLRNTTNATTGCAAPAAVAPAQHALAWGVTLSNSSAPVLYIGNDGGLWRSLDGVRQQQAVCSADDATHFNNLNGSLGSLAEVVSLSSHPTDGTLMLAALAENGAAASTSASQATGAAPWAQLTAAESDVVGIDQGSGATWLVQSGSGVALHACAAGTQCSAADFAGAAAIGFTQTSSDTSRVDPPALLDPALNTNVLVGTCRVWRGPAGGGGLWSSSNAISAPMLGILSAGTCTSGNATIRSLGAGGLTQLNSAAQNSGSPVLYAGLSGAAEGGAAAAGHIFTTSAAGTAGSATHWTDLTGNSVVNDTSRRFNPAGYDISGIAVDPADPSGMTVYATVQGFYSPHVYRSVNGGATWWNITANLPNAPANAVAVDPGNPRVVYVAMDTGVYVTVDVTSCVSATTDAPNACWSVYGTSLPNAPVLALSVAARATIPGTSSTGVLRAGTYGRGIWQTPLFTAGQSAAPAATLSPASLTFGVQAAGTTSAAQTVTLTNSGSATLQVSGVQVSAGFLDVDTCSGTSITINASCTLSVRFAPVTAGMSTGTLQVLANVPGGYASLPLTGTATGGARLAVSPASIAFAATAVNATSAPQAVTVSNTGSAAATVLSPVVSSGYSVAATTCGASLAAGATCAVSVTFAPTSAGPNNGTLTVGSGAVSATVQLSATAVGTPNIVYSSTSLSFGWGPVGSLVSGAVFSWTNTGTAAGAVSYPIVTGDFSLLQDTCPSVVFPGITCSVLVFFSPSGTGLRTGTLVFTDGAGTHTIALSGTGVPATALSVPQDVYFPDTPVNSVSAAQTLTLTNSGNFAIFGVLQTVGDFAIRSNTCSGLLLMGASCSMQVIFAPSAQGQRDGYLQIPFGSLTYNTRLHGSGTGQPAVAIAPSALAFGPVGLGSRSNPQTVTVANTGTGVLALQSQTVTPAFLLVSSTCAGSLAPSASCALTVAFAPTATGAQSGTLTMVDALGTHTISLTGTGSGQASVAVTPATVAFGTVPLGQTAMQDVSVANSGTAAIGLATPVATGDFSVAATTCTTNIAAGAACTVTVRFAPTVDGTRAGALTVADTSSAHTVILSGTGKGTAAVAFTPSSLAFGNTSAGAHSPPQTVTLSNTGSTMANLGAPLVQGEFSLASNTCGTTLGTGSTCTLGISFAPAGSGFRSGAVSIADNVGLHSAALQGTGVSGALSASPAAVAFYDTPLNTVTAARTITLTNFGNGPLTVSAVTVTDQFTVSSNCAGVVLQGGGTCTLSATFAPTTAGGHTGTITVTSNSNGVAGTTSSITLTGNGESAFNIAVMPTAVTFGTQLVGTASAVNNVTVSNTGTTTGGLGGMTVNGGDFSIRANTCGTSLPPQTGCTLSLVFTPLASGPRSGVLTIQSDAGVQTVALSGTGQAAATDSLSVAALTFSPQTVATASAPQTVTLTNNGDVALTLVSAQIASGDFAAVNACGASVPAHTSCAISVLFAPRSVGAASGTLQISDVQRVQTVMLNGTAVATAGVTLSPSSIFFANTGVGVVGASQTLTLTNNSSASVTVGSLTTTGEYGVMANDTSCATVSALPPAGACQVQVAFLPQAAGLRTGAVSVATSSGTFSSQMSGTGVDFSLSANGSTTATVASGNSATYPLLLRPASATNDAVTFTCSGAPTNSRCTVTSQYADLSAVSTVSVTLQTGTAAASLRFALLMPLLLLPVCCRRNATRRATQLLALSLAALMVQGCGSTRVSAISGSGGGGGGTGTSATTPAGTYTLTVSATAAGVTHSVPLTLTVQ